jgi:hypothetical protein
VADPSHESTPDRTQDHPSTFTPFAHLADVLKRKT